MRAESGEGEFDDHRRALGGVAVSVVGRVEHVADFVVRVAGADEAHRQFTDQHTLALHLDAEVDPPALTRQLDDASSFQVFLRGGAVERSEVEVAHDVGIREQRVVAIEVIGRQRAE